MTKLYIMLGRHGDIMSILPFLYADFQRTGEKQGLMVAAECAPLLEGVSYVDLVVHDGPHYEIEKAVLKAREICPNVICCQVNGPVSQIKEYTYKPSGTEAARATSFQKEQWRVAGRLPEWDSCLPLAFDKRDKERETALLRKFDLIKRGKQKPLMLLALKSNSSPFPYADLLRELVTNKFKDDFRILELPQAERLYDLLAIYERADMLIAADSAPLHLAWGCRGLPVFALAQDKPILWNGSPWRPNMLWYCRYHDWPARAMEMLGSISALKVDRLPDEAFVTTWNAYEDREVYQMRKSVLPIKRGMCSRDSGNSLKDDSRHPYLKDVLRMAMQRAHSDDAQIYLTRSSVSIKANIDTLPKPCFSYRMRQVDGGLQFSPIVDVFAATKGWWKSVLSEIPDLILNLDYQWGQCLWALFKQHGATDATGVSVYTGGAE